MENVTVFLKANWWLLLAIAAIAIALFQLVDPAPPREITIATGEPGGRYYGLGEYLRDELQQEGVTLKIVQTAGSGENMERLVDPDDEVSIAFVQSGMEQIFDSGETELSSLGSLYYEPIWLFYRNPGSLESIGALKGSRVAAGRKGSGTRAVARYLLAENGLLGDDGVITLVDEGGDRAVELLQAGEIDAAFFTVSPQSEIIRTLIDSPGIDFLDIRRSPAYTARYAFLSSVPISEGLLDLEQNIPDTDRRTLASTATLVVNDRFHPAFTPLILELLARRLGRGSVLEAPGEFPSPSNVGFGLTREAEHFYDYGPPFLMRYMPFWAASLVDRMIIFVIPLLVIIIPLSKVAGPLYRWRIRSRIFTWYRHLLDTDRRIVEGAIADPAEELRQLDRLADELAGVEVPLSHSDELYHLKQHLEYVKRRLRTRA
ncbi:MAG: TAXI family TRAP transporter solute-binding subunit [Xanthomonadales bacterium]